MLGKDFPQLRAAWETIVSRLKLKSSSLTITVLLLIVGMPAQAQTIFAGYDCGEWTRRAKNHPMESWQLPSSLGRLGWQARVQLSPMNGSLGT